MTTKQINLKDNTVIDIISELHLGFADGCLLTNIIVDAVSGNKRMDAETAECYYQMRNYCEEFGVVQPGNPSKQEVKDAIKRLKKAYPITRHQATLCWHILSWRTYADFREMTKFMERHAMIGKGALDHDAKLGAMWRFCMEYRLPYFSGILMQDLKDTRTELMEYHSVIATFGNVHVQYKRDVELWGVDTSNRPDPVVLSGHDVFSLPWMSPKLADIFKALASVRAENDLFELEGLLNAEKDAFVKRVTDDIAKGETSFTGAGGARIVLLDQIPIPTDY